MEKHYEMPKVQVVRYQKRVKTNTEMFTDSSGVQQINISCPKCNQLVFTVRADQLGVITAYPPDLNDPIVKSYYTAAEAHEDACPVLNPPRPPMPI